MNELQDLKDKCKELGIQFSPNDTIAKLKTKLKNKTMSDATKKGVITKEQIDAWKVEHKKVYKISVTVAEGDIAVGYLRKPTRNHKATALSMYSKDKILECGEFLRDNCWLGGDERLKTAEDIADSAAIQASGIIKFMDGELGEA